MKNHETQWQHLQAAWAQNRMPQALLCVGPMQCGLRDFAIRLSQLMLCKTNWGEGEKLWEPCTQCTDCQMVSRLEHPDMEWIKPEKVGQAIKIEAIRTLQQTVFLTPQRAKHRIILIESADHMNPAASNALLKILEEPAHHTIFILMAQQVGTLLPTIISRCRLLSFASMGDFEGNNLLALGAHYPKESEEALMIARAEPLLDGLIAMLEHKEHPCVLAASWSAFEWPIVLWFLYLVFAQLQIMQFTTKQITGPGSAQLSQLNALLNPVLIFKQLDKLNTLQRQLHQHVHLNWQLALDNLLCSLMEGVACNQSQ